MAKIQPHWRFYDCKFEEILIKTDAALLGQLLPNYKSTGPFCCHGNYNFQRICLKTFCSQSLTLTMLYIRYDQDWLVDEGDISVKMSGQRGTTNTDDRGCYCTSSFGEIKKRK